MSRIRSGNGVVLVRAQFLELGYHPVTGFEEHAELAAFVHVPRERGNPPQGYESCVGSLIPLSGDPSELTVWQI